MTITLGSGPTHPTPTHPRPPAPPPPRPTGPPPPPPGKATGPTGPDPIGDPPPDPGPARPRRHLVDFGWRLEVRSCACELLAVAQVNGTGWDIQVRPGGPVVRGDREAAETCMRALAVAP